MKISVIIPVYNAEKYLGECIESVLNQKLNKGDTVEIIASVDNNTTDNSLAVLAKYPSVKIVKCATPGAAAVRNFGLKYATGDYLWFLDADDYVANGILAKLIKEAKAGAELVTYQVKRFVDGTNADAGLLKPIDVTKKDWKHRFVRCGFGIWNFLISKEWFVRNKLYFHEGIICEDVAIVGSYILYTDKVSVIDEVGYYYRQRTGSISHPRNWGKESLDIFVALEDLKDRFVKAGKFDEYCDDLEYVYIWHLPVDLPVSLRGNDKYKKEGIKKMRKLMSKEFPKWRSNKYLKAKGIKIRLRTEIGFWGLA